MRNSASKYQDIVMTDQESTGPRASDQKTNTELLFAADRRHLLHPQHHPIDHQQPVLWVSGDGPYLIASDGRKYLDGLSSMWNVNLGHSRRELIDAAHTQLSTLPFATAYAGSSHRPVIELASMLSEIVYPSIKAFYFTNAGSDATDTSIRTSRFFWRTLGRPEKTKIIARQLSYHGSSVGSASATGVAEFSDVFGPRLPGFLHIDSPYPYRFGDDNNGKSQGIAAADLLEEAILREGPESVAAFIAEPIQGGGGGVIVPQDDYFPRIREICNRYEVLLISDDVITGFGRSGRWFGLQHWGVEPDIVQFAKGITGGYIPLGGIGVSARIKDVLDHADPGKRWWHGYTYSGHPVACAVAIASINVLRRERLVERSAILGERLLSRLRDGLAAHPHVGEVRGLGLLAGIELVADKPTKLRFPSTANFSGRLKAEFMARGLCTRVLTDIICLAPPLICTDQEIDRIADIIVDTLNANFATTADFASTN
jgi:adenosylmethionine-8-amino-7-oxononanoate aminotransferase